MKRYKLTKEEKEILDAYERGEFVSEASEKSRKLYQQYAAYTLRKTKNINIRVTEKVLHKLKTKAMEEGIPYQTLISSLLHKFVSQ